MTSATEENYEPAGTGDAGPEPGDAPDAGPGLRASLEAILLVADEPVPLVVLAQVLERPRNEVEAELRDLAASYVAEGRGFDLREVAGGWRFYTREDCAPLVERFVSDGQEVRLTQAALETLAQNCREASPMPAALLQTLSPLHDTAEEVRNAAHALGGAGDSILLGAAASESGFRARPLDQACDQLGRDRNTRFVLPILARVSIIG